jgi:glycerate dehydrogenase
MELRQIKIVLLDSYTEKPGDLSWNDIEKLGEFVYYDHSPNDEDETVKRIGDAEIVLTNKTPISRSVLEKCPNVKSIAVLATGYNVIDCDFAAERGIPVSNVPIYDTATVGQFAIALLLEICHHVAVYSDVVHASRWTSYSDWCFWDYPLIELDGKTIGIIAFGKMEQTTGCIAKLMGMKVLATGSRPNESGKKSQNIQILILCLQNRMLSRCTAHFSQVRRASSIARPSRR